MLQAQTVFQIFLFLLAQSLHWYQPGGTKMKKSAGFTLMELMVVLGIIGIAALIAVPNIYRWIANQRLNSAAWLVKGAIERTRMSAVRNNTRTIIAFDPNAETFLAFIDVNPDNAWDPDSDTLLFEGEMPPGIDLVSASFAGGQPWIRYNGRGLPNGTGGTVVIRDSRGLSHNIIVNITGRVRID